MVPVEVCGRDYFASFTDTKPEEKKPHHSQSSSEAVPRDPDNGKPNHKDSELPPETMEKLPQKNVDTTRSLTAES